MSTMMNNASFHLHAGKGVETDDVSIVASRGRVGMVGDRQELSVPSVVRCLQPKPGATFVQFWFPPDGQSTRRRRGPTDAVLVRSLARALTLQVSREQASEECTKG